VAGDYNTNSKGPKAGEMLSMDEVFLNRLREAIEANLENHDFNVDELGREIGMSRSQIHKKLNKLTGQSASRFIRSYKLQKAKELLRKYVGTVSEVSDLVGFSSPAYFGQVYLDEFGYPPNEERKIGQEETTGKEIPTIDRQLAAIMFTDIVGYSKILAEDETKGLDMLNKAREIQKSLIKHFGGHTWREVSGEMLSSFSNSADAVICAQAIQRKVIENEIPLSIGIHEGEIIMEEDDIMGDGVNLASNIIDHTLISNIFISESVYKNVLNKKGIKTEFINEVEFNNVAHPVKIYRIVLDVDPLVGFDNITEGLIKGEASQVNILKNGKPKSKHKILLGSLALLIILIGSIFYYSYKPTSETKDVISIAIMPFHNPSDDESQKQYGVGLATAIRSKLSQSKHFEFISSMRATMGYDNTDSPVKIGNELEVKYLLSGIYQISGDRIRVDVELIDTQSGGGVWNLSFNELFTDIFELQSKIASKVFNEFAMADNQDQDLPTQNIEAYGHYLKGLELWSYQRNNSVPGLLKRNLEAEEQLKLAIQIDSSFIDPYVTLVNIKTSWLWSFRLIKTIRESEEYAMVMEEVMNLKDYSERHFSGSWKNILIQAHVAYHGNSDFDEGLKLYEEVLNHDPENFDAHNGLGAIYKRKLMQHKAIFHRSKARIMNPGDAIIWNEMMFVFWSLGDYSSAEKAAQNAINLGLPANSFTELFFEQGKTYPGAKELNPLYYYRTERFFKRDYAGIIALYDTTKLATIQSNYYWKAMAYYLLGIQDSVKFYGQLWLDNTDNPAPADMFAILGNKEKALNVIRERRKHTVAGGSDILGVCSLIEKEIQLLSILGDYKEATDLLINLNRLYPNFAEYAKLFSHPTFDKIKSEYPPFVEALNNLKLPPKLDLEGLLEL